MHGKPKATKNIHKIYPQTPFFPLEPPITLGGGKDDLQVTHVFMLCGSSQIKNRGDTDVFCPEGQNSAGPRTHAVLTHSFGLAVPALTSHTSSLGSSESHSLLLSPPSTPLVPAGPELSPPGFQTYSMV